MTDDRSPSDARAWLETIEAPTPPPPSAHLLASVARMRRVRMRAPLVAATIITAVAFVYPVYALTRFPPRADWPLLSLAWRVGVGALWLLGFVVPLLMAVLPRARQVLPDAARAANAALAAVVGLVLIGFLVTVDAPGATVLVGPDALVPSLRGCLVFGLKVSMPVLLAGWFALRRARVAGAARLGFALGAAGGALGGAVLHALCPVGNGAHVALAHGGGVALGAIAGAGLMALTQRFGQSSQ